MVFQQNLLEKAYFITKMSGLTMFWPASSDFLKAPSEMIAEIPYWWHVTT